MNALNGLKNVLICCIWTAVAYILFDRSAKQKRHLRDIADLFADDFLGYSIEINTANGDGAFSNFMKAKQDAGNRRFSCTRMSD
ncbi:hypothetical protein D3C80_1987080 [compost metagenome]